MKHHVDWNLNRLILEPAETKNKEGKFFRLTKDLKQNLQEQQEATQLRIPYDRRRSADRRFRSEGYDLKLP